MRGWAKTPYDDFGRLSNTEIEGDDDTQMWGYTYNDIDGQPINGLTVGVDAFGETDYLTLDYNGLGQLVEEVQIGGITTAYEQDSQGRLIMSTLPYTNTQNRRELETEYDALGRPINAETRDGMTNYAYPSWQVTTVTDALGSTTVYELGSLGRVMTVIEPGPEGSVTTSYQYRDNTTNPSLVIMGPDGITTTIHYDSLGRKTALDDPDMGQWAYTYDERGNLSTQTDARGITTTLGYDELGQVITKTYAIPTDTAVADTALVRYDYDDGLRTDMWDGSGHTNWEHDTFGRLLTETKTIDGYTFITGYSYDEYGRLQTMTYPDGEVVTYTHNIANQIVGVAGQDVYLAKATYNPLGQPTTWGLGGVITQTIGYDPVTFWPAAVAAVNLGLEQLQDLTLYFDGVGHLDWWQDDSQSASIWLNPAYDSLNRLGEIGSSNELFEQAYSYDDLGNITFRDGLTLTYNLPDRPHLPGEDSAGTSYEYDANGNMTSRTLSSGTIISYTYDAENQLTKVISDTGTQAAITRLVYDGDASLVIKEIGDEQEMYIGDYYMTDGTPGILNNSWITTTSSTLQVNNSVLAVHLEGYGDFASVSHGNPNLRYLATTENGFMDDVGNNHVEDWGVADVISSESGYSADDGINMSVVRFASSVDDLAISSIVQMDTIYEVDHDFHPSTNPNLYEITVSVTNISANEVDLIYRRTANWQAGCYGCVYITIAGTTTWDEVDAAVFPASLYPSADPLVTPSGGLWGDVTDYGPGELVTLFDFDFGSLEPGETKRFNLYYGAADDEATALALLDSVGAKAYALAQPATDPVNGTTFIFAYGDYTATSSTKRYFAGGQQLATRIPNGNLYYHLNDPSGTSLIMTDANGDEAGRMLYDGFGAVLTNTLPLTLTLTGALPDVPDAATGLAHLGGGRYYDPALGRPLQPNPAGGPPTVPQALNRYAATPLGQPGVYEAAASSNTVPFSRFLSTSAWMGASGNAGLEVAGRHVVVDRVISGLTVQGRRPALRQALSSISYDLSLASISGGRWGKFIVNNSNRIPFVGSRVQNKLLDWMGSYRATTRGETLIEELGGGRYFFRNQNVTIDVAKFEVTKHQRAILLGEARLARTLSSMGVTFALDAGLELFGAATGTGRWGNPYWTTRQKGVQASLVVGSDAALAGTLALSGVSWPVAIPTAFLWAVFADDFFASLPYTAQYYIENRNLHPLQLDP